MSVFTIPPSLEANKLVTPNIITVDASGSGDAQTTEQALALRVANFGANEQVVIRIQPHTGSFATYQENNPLVVPFNTEISGNGLLAVTVEALNAGAPLFRANGGNTQFRNLILQAATSSDVGIEFSGAGTNVMEYLSGSVGIMTQVIDSNSTILIQNCLGLGASKMIELQAGNVLATKLWCVNATNMVDASGGIFMGTDLNPWLTSAEAIKITGTSTVILSAVKPFVCDTAISIDDTASLRADSLDCIFSTTYDVDQRASGAVVLINGMAGNTTKFNITNPLSFVVLNVFDNAAGGLRLKKNSYGANATIDTNDQISAVTAGAITLTLPTVNGGAIINEYPAKFIVVDESGLGTSTLAAAGGDTLDGVVNGTMAIPATGSISVYALTTGWRTL